MPARAPIWGGMKITPIFREKAQRGGGTEFQDREGAAIQAEKFEARGGTTIGVAGADGVLSTRVRFKVRALALGGAQPDRIREADGKTWEVESISTPSPDAMGNRGARGIVFIEAVSVGKGK